jgi:hypothetical protein
MSQPFLPPDSVNVMLAQRLADRLSMSVNEVLSLCDRFDRRVEYQYRIALITIADFAAFFPGAVVTVFPAAPETAAGSEQQFGYLISALRQVFGLMALPEPEHHACRVPGVVLVAGGAVRIPDLCRHILDLNRLYRYVSRPRIVQTPAR